MGIPSEVPPHKRKAERYNYGKKDWEHCEFSQLVSGDIFRLFEFDGVPVIWKGGCVFVAITDAKEQPGLGWMLHYEVPDFMPDN